MEFIGASVARALFDKVSKNVSRIRKEHAAGKQPSIPEPILDQELKETLQRLRSGVIDESWWKNILVWIGHEYITPEFLEKSAIQEWLNDTQNEADFLSLARNIVMGKSGNLVDCRERLKHSYSIDTGENEQFANSAIDVVLSILSAGCFASIPSDSKVIAGMIQEVDKNVSRGFDDISRKLDEIQYNLGNRQHIENQQTHIAEEELTKILSIRALDSIQSLNHLLSLLNRTIEGRDLSFCDESTKKKIRYWTARLYASEKNLSQATRLRDELQESNLILDALILDGEGNAEEALRILRDESDPDSKTVFFHLLNSNKGAKVALDWFDSNNKNDDLELFTAFGWCNWAICAATDGRWKDVVETLVKLEDLWKVNPALAFVEGGINAALLLPEERRDMVLDGLPLYPSISPIFHSNVVECHQRATYCFKHVEKNWSQDFDKEFNDATSDWRIWLRLMNPDLDQSKEFKNSISERLSSPDSNQAVRLIRFAHFFEIDFNPQPMKSYLDNRRDFGGLEPEEQRAEFLINRKIMKPPQFLEFAQSRKDELSRIFQVGYWLAEYCDVMLQEPNLSSEYGQLIAEYRQSVDDANYERMIDAIDAKQGIDVRGRLEERFRQTKSTLDLKNLIAYFRSADNWTALKPYCWKLFKEAPTREHARELVEVLCNSSPAEYQEILQLAEKNPSIFESDDNLLKAKIVALFNTGSFKDAEQLNQDYFGSSLEPFALLTELKIDIAFGKWESIGASLERIWEHKENFEANDLIWVSHVAANFDQMRKRAVEFADLATRKSPLDPQILLSAYSLCFETNQEEQANPDWLSNAMRLSSSETGPVYSADLAQIVEEIIPKRRRSLQNVEKNWFSGKIPLSFAAAGFNISPVNLLLHIPTQNESESDGRRKLAIPIVAGRLNPIELSSDWTVGLDITSIFVLYHLELLTSVFDVFNHIKLPPQTNAFLLSERSQVRFHQPSRIKAAKQVSQLVGNGRIVVSDKPVNKSAEITAKYGYELAEFVQLAKSTEGRVVVSFPVYTADSLGQQLADITEIDDFIVSLLDFCRILHEQGKLESFDYQNVRSYLINQGEIESGTTTSDLLDKPVYFEELALNYLLDLKILKRISREVVIHINSEAFSRIQAYIHEDNTGEFLVEAIDNIRHLISQAVDSGKASFLPFCLDGMEQQAPQENLLVQGTRSMLRSSEKYDALSIDDRYFNNYRINGNSDEKTPPIICILDILQHMYSQRELTIEDLYDSRHKLRNSGFVFVPPDSDELLYWLKLNTFDNRKNFETPELRAIRQSLILANLLESIDRNEAFVRSRYNAVVVAKSISNVWKNYELTQENAQQISNWIWLTYLPTISDGTNRDLVCETLSKFLAKVLSHRIGSLLVMTLGLSTERQGQFSEWLEKGVLNSLRVANENLIVEALKSAKNIISGVDSDEKLLMKNFLLNLSERNRKKCFEIDRDLAPEFGYGVDRVISIPPQLKIVDSHLYQVAEKALADQTQISGEDLFGKQYYVDIDQESGEVGVNWEDDAGNIQNILMPELSLLSSNEKFRHRMLVKVLDKLGPTTEFHNVLDEIDLRKINFNELSDILKECHHGVAANQEILNYKFKHNISMQLSELIPAELSYYEKFAGPVPTNTHEPNEYFNSILATYRKKLIRNELLNGIEISCMGALNDNLLPGRWLIDYSNEDVWNALSSSNALSSPTLLLGALDIALYRQEDPRFLEFAETAVAKLADLASGETKDLDLYSLYYDLAEFAINRINILENSSQYPGYWKRMAAWMQAGVIVNNIAEYSDDNKYEDIRKWFFENLDLSGKYAELFNSKNEPMLFGFQFHSLPVRYEIIRRLQLLQRRHQSEGRGVPSSAAFDAVITEFENSEINFEFPGLLEHHIQPKQRLPEDIKIDLNEAQINNEFSVLRMLMVLSQFYNLENSELSLAENAIEAIREKYSEKDSSEILTEMRYASFIATTCRVEAIANSIAEVLIESIHRLSEEELQSVPGIIVVAAGAIGDHDEWFTWLRDRFETISERIPQSNHNKLLNLFLIHLDAMEVVLPIDSWFHLRSKAKILSAKA